MTFNRREWADYTPLTSEELAMIDAHLESAYNQVQAAIWRVGQAQRLVQQREGAAAALPLTTTRRHLEMDRGDLFGLIRDRMAQKMGEEVPAR